MTDDERLALVAAIHDAPGLLVLAVAGGGNAVITDLLDVPGASRTVLEVRVPYAEAALSELIESHPVGDAGAVSSAMAEAMAEACFDRANALAPDAPSVIGVAVTAALVSDRPKKGEHRAHVAVTGSSGSTSSRVDLVKGELDRRGEDRVVADAVLGAVAAAMGLERSPR